MVLGPKKKTKNSAVAVAPAGAERDVAEQIQRAENMRKTGEPK